MAIMQKKKLQQLSYRYQPFYQALMLVLLGGIFLLLIFAGVAMYQVIHRPLPLFTAVAADHKQMQLTAFDQPNLLPETLLRWASKAAVAAYTFDFVNYEKQAELARPYFTSDGWNDYQNSLGGLIETIKQNQLFVNSVVAGPPVISNQGDLPGRGYSWRVQIPFLVTYQSAGVSTRRDFTVVLTIVKVPTDVNPMGIGIDQFFMAKG